MVHGHGLALDLQDGLVGGRGEPYAMGDFFERGPRFFDVRADVAESCSSVGKLEQNETLGVQFDIVRANWERGSD